MTAITIRIPHTLGKTEARRRIADGLGGMRQQLAGAGLMQLEHTWQEDTLSFTARALAQRVTGRMTVLDDALHVEIDLPALLARLANAIKGRVQREATVLLEDKRKK